MPQIDTYSTGTVSMVSGSNTITGSGTAWMSGSPPAYAIVAGHQIVIGNYVGVIESVNSATSITVRPAWPNANLSGQTYKVYRTTRIDTPEVLGGLQALKAQIDGTTAVQRTTLDSGAMRMVLRDDGAANASIFVGNTGVADGSMLEALEFDRATGAARFRAGTAALPSITPIGDSNTGMFSPAADTIAWSAGGTEVARFNSTGIFSVGSTTLSGARGSMSVSADTGSGVFGDFDGNGQLILSGRTSSLKRLGLGVDTAAATMVGVVQAVEAGVATRPLALNPNGGPVGVGTKIPQQLLHVAGNITVNGDLYKHNDTSAQAIYGGSAFNKGAGIVLFGDGHAGSPNVTLFTNGSYVERMRINAAGSVGIGRSAIGAMLDIQASADGADALLVRAVGGSKFLTIKPETSTNTAQLFYWNGSGAGTLQITGLQFQSTATFAVDNTMNIGSASFRGATAFFATGTINTSDGREKTTLRSLTAEERAAAQELAGSIGVYQWLASVEEKGEDKARLHVGLIAQEVEAVMKKHGLDPWRYGFMCKDPITMKVKRTETRKVQKTETVTETYTEIEIVDGVPTQVEKTREVKQPVVEMVQVRDAKGALLFTERDGETGAAYQTTAPQYRPSDEVEPVRHPVPVMIDETVEIEVDEPAGERLGLRYDQVYGFILAGMAAA